MVSNIKIKNSTFFNNSECISIVVNKTMNLAEAFRVNFNVKDSSFHSNEGSCVSFSESSDNKQSVSVNITLENVTFSDNKFSSKGLVFLDIENGNQYINLQKVKFIKNSALSGRNVFANDSHSERIVHSKTVDIFIYESNFSSTNARSFLANALIISMEIFNSSFGGSKCEGNGGVIFLKGTDLCKVNVSNSSFVNTSAFQGGAFDIECMEVRFNLLESIFLLNNATKREGGAALIIGYRASVWFLNSSFTNSLTEAEVKSYEMNRGGALFVTSDLLPMPPSTFQASHLVGGVFLTVERCRFFGCTASIGGSLYVGYNTHLNLQLVIKDSEFISNHAYSEGAAVGTGRAYYTGVMTDECGSRNTCIFETSIENSTFSRNVGTVLLLLGDFSYHITF